MTDHSLQESQELWTPVFDDVSTDLEEQARDMCGIAGMDAGKMVSLDTYDLHQIRHREVTVDRLEEIKAYLFRGSNPDILNEPTCDSDREEDREHDQEYDWGKQLRDDEKAWNAANGRFDPRFLRPCPPSHLEGKLSAATLWLEGNPEELQALVSELREPRGTESEKQCTTHFVSIVNEIGKMIYGDEAAQFNHNGKTKLKPNIDLMYHTGGSRNPYDSSVDVKPTLVISKERNSRSSVDNWKEADLVGEIRAHDRKDMRCTAKDDQENMVPRMLRHQQAFVYNHPITGGTFSLSLAGHSVRLWSFDASSYASSRVCRFDTPEHYRELVDIVAFILQPNLPQQRTWSPLDGFTCRDGEDGPFEKWLWTDTPTLLEVRMELFESRTVVWTGMAYRENESSQEATRVFLKISFTLNNDAAHEYKMCKHLHDPTVEVIKYGSRQPDPEVVKCLPTAKGIPHLPPGWRTQTLGGRYLEANGLLSGGVLGEPIPMIKRPDFGIRAYVQVLQGVDESLWYAATKGIHYRDINEGNVFWIKLGDRYIGYLIDFGNARYLMQHRVRGVALEKDENTVLSLCRDDGRSINPFFQSVASMHAESAVTQYRKVTKQLITALDKIPADPDLVATKKANLMKIKTQAEKLVHRYTDDLESARYFSCYCMILVDLRKLAINDDHREFDMSDLEILGQKMGHWDSDLVEFSEAPAVRKGWTTYIQNTARVIRTTRQKLGAVSPWISKDEYLCFQRVVETADTVLESLPLEGW